MGEDEHERREDDDADSAEEGWRTSERRVYDDKVEHRSHNKQRRNAGETKLFHQNHFSIKVWLCIMSGYFLYFIKT